MILIAYINVSKGMFIWKRVVPGEAVTLLLAKPSFTKRLYETSCPSAIYPSQKLALPVSCMVSMSRLKLVPGKQVKNNQSVY